MAVRRTKYLINREFQQRYALLTLGLLLFYTLFLLALIFSPYILTLYFDFPLSEKAQAARVILLLHNKIWPGVGIGMLFLAALSLFITHRIAGPLYRIGESLRKMADGDLGLEVKLRKGDEFHELADQLNHLAGELRKPLAALQDENAVLAEVVERVRREAEAGAVSGESALEMAEQLASVRTNNEVILEKFRF